MRVRTSASAFSSSFSVAVRICTICWRMVSRSSTNSTSSLETSTSVIWCDNRTTFSRVSLMLSTQPLGSSNSSTSSDARQGSPQHQLAVARQLRFHLLVHLLVGHAGAPHLVLMLYQNFAHFVVQAVLDGQLFHHALAHTLRHRLRRLALNQVPFDQPFHDFRGHVAHIIPNDQHSKRVLYPIALTRYKG